MLGFGKLLSICLQNILDIFPELRDGLALHPQGFKLAISCSFNA